VYEYDVSEYGVFINFCSYICCPGRAQSTIATVVSSPAADGSSDFQVSSALNLTCVITPTPGDGVAVSYEWVADCENSICFGNNGQTTATIGTRRLGAADSGTYECRPVVDGVMVFSAQFTVRVIGEFI